VAALQGNRKEGARARVADDFYRGAAQAWPSHRSFIDVAPVDGRPYRKKKETNRRVSAG
jgi:hypothetical protein